MAEYVDDTKTFTITLKTTTATTPIPSTAKVSLDWVQQNYDTNNSRYIETTELQAAGVDRSKGAITQDQYNAVAAAKVMHTLLPAPSGVSKVSRAAKGELVSVSYPPSGVLGSRVSVSCRVKNTGTISGMFVIDVSGGTKGIRTSSFSVSAGSTSVTKVIGVTLPTYGSQITYTMKCIRIT